MHQFCCQGIWFLIDVVLLCQICTLGRDLIVPMCGWASINNENIIRVLAFHHLREERER